eukprot:TRINITY_DN373_c0_g1_i1.p1 TRINITY_DN373_c0_g1~~TRINITY_DN373_c0_g1_i1.p1  ORF type:complete len:244 (+),score=46.79 TRINITY_DN373_c0_g1_i1:333-1064(+)
MGDSSKDGDTGMHLESKDEHEHHHEHHQHDHDEQDEHHNHHHHEHHDVHHEESEEHEQDHEDHHHHLHSYNDYNHHVGDSEGGSEGASISLSLPLSPSQQDMSVDSMTGSTGSLSQSGNTPTGSRKRGRPPSNTKRKWKTIRVTEDVFEAIKNIEFERKHCSANETIRYLIEKYSPPPTASHSSTNPISLNLCSGNGLALPHLLPKIDTNGIQSQGEAESATNGSEKHEESSEVNDEGVESAT